MANWRYICEYVIDCGILLLFFNKQGIEEKSTCRQCKKKDKGKVVRCTKCKRKRFCLHCLKNRYVQLLCVCNLMVLNSGYGRVNDFAISAVMAVALQITVVVI
jgi:hypothetical protein